MGCQNNYIMIKFEKIYPKRTDPNGAERDQKEPTPMDPNGTTMDLVHRKEGKNARKIHMEFKRYFQNRR